jgi:hypothetical protein
MDIVVSQRQGRVPVTVFHLKGDLTGEEPLQTEANMAHEDGARYLALDLGDVPFISSGGLRAIHYVYMLMRRGEPAGSSKTIKEGIAAGTYRSPHLKLVNPNKNALRALSVAGYDMFLEIHPTVDEAVASF